MSPVVIALILHSCYRLAKLGMEDWLQMVHRRRVLPVAVVLQAEVAVLFIAAGTLGALYYGTLWRKSPTARKRAALAGLTTVSLLIAF